MVETSINRDIPFDGHNYQLVEYLDTFLINPKKRAKIKDLGVKVTAISTFFFDYLKEYHVPTSFHKKESDNSLKLLSCKEFPFRVKLLNSADKRISKLFSLKEGNELKLPVFEFHYGNGKETLISESHLISFDLCTAEEMKLINRACSKINAVLKSFFERRNEIMVEISCNFGKFEDKIFLTGDFSPASLKVVQKNGTKKSVDPYKLSSAPEIKKYTDHLYEIAKV